MSAIYPDPKLDALLEEDAQLKELLSHENAARVSLLYASNDTRDHFKKRLHEVQLQIAILKGEPAA